MTHDQLDGIQQIVYHVLLYVKGKRKSVDYVAQMIRWMVDDWLESGMAVENFLFAISDPDESK